MVAFLIYLKAYREGDGALYNDSHKANPSAYQLETFQMLGQRGTRFWPHPACDIFTQEKFRMQTTVARAVKKAGGFAERPFQVDSVAEGLKALETGFVIKMEHGADAEYVFKTNDEENRKQFKKMFDLVGAPTDDSIEKRMFFSMKFNQSILALGEVRVFICFGKILQAYHTLPTPMPQEKGLGRDKWTWWTAHPAFGRLASLGEIK